MKIAVITGASSGIGEEFAKELPKCCKHLDELWVFARRKEKLEQLAAALPLHTRIFRADLSGQEWDSELLEALETERPDIRVLVNAAGYGKIGTTAGSGQDELLGMIDVNCRALTKMTLDCIPYMNPGARIIQIASAAAFSPQPGFNVYAATKAYVLSFSRALGEELRGRGISVTAVCPGPVDTAFFEVSGTTDSFAKKGVMTSAGKVVRQALRDAKNRKDISVYGVWMKAAAIAAKLIPHRIVVRIMSRI